MSLNEELTIWMKLFNNFYVAYPAKALDNFWDFEELASAIFRKYRLTYVFINLS